ncbi:MAG: YfiT family bacillithiol transferase [Thermoanaerobaculia bacterium]
MNDLRYPIGPFTAPADPTAATRESLIATIAACPAELRRVTRGLSDAQLETPYRDGGWTVRQVVHHVPDSHMNAYVRHKLTATQLQPTINPYEESLWAELADAKSGDIEVSLVLLTQLHDRWVRFLRALEPEAFARTFVHPAYDHLWTLDASVALYAWHSRHHVAHIDALRQRMGW